ncbi:MAG TPA: GNAT family N-acetyltransferase [Acidimicrobiia bacterium]|nr:GNAT family N-acetyltransferase [Acidimicrobiia bacterium]
MVDGWQLDELAGKLVRLREPRLDDLDAFVAFADSDGDRLAGETNLPRTAEQSRRWLDDLLTRPREDDTAFLVLESAEGAVAGSVSVNRANRRHGRFSYGIALFPPFRRRGIGSEAIVLLLRFYFGELRYQRCETEIYAFNDASLALHEKLGFVVEGRRRRALFTQGEFHDIVTVAMLREEFADRHGLLASSP